MTTGSVVNIHQLSFYTCNIQYKELIVLFLNHFILTYIVGTVCSKISNTLKLRTPKIIAENIFQNILKNRTLTFFWKSEFLKLRTQGIFGGKSMSVYARFTYTVQRHLEGSILLKWVI